MFHDFFFVILTYHVITYLHQKRKNQKVHGNENRDVNNGDDTVQSQMFVKATEKQPGVSHKSNKPWQQSTKTNKLFASLIEDVKTQKTSTTPTSTLNKSATMITGLSSMTSTSFQLPEITG